MRKEYIIAHDLGTSGNKAVLYNFDGKLLSSSVYSYTTYYPDNGFAEQNPDDWWKSVCISTKELLERSNADKKEIACITFSGQMMGCLPVDINGMHLRNSIIWADTRSSVQASFMQHQIGMEYVYKTTGHRISSSYSAAKLLWIKDNEPEIYKKTHKMLQAKDYIIHKLTNNFVTDYSDASGTNLFNLEKKVWSDEIVAALELNSNLLPSLLASTDLAGTVTRDAAELTGLLEGTPVIIGGGDGSCAAAGSGVIEEGKIYNVLGSSSWIASASKKPVYDEKMCTFNWAHVVDGYYTPCGTMQAACNSLSWFKNNLCEFENLQARDIGKNAYQIIDENILKSPPGANSVLFLPYLLGERSPRWNMDASGVFFGLKMNTSKSDISRAVLEGIGYNLKIILNAVNRNNDHNDIIMIGGGAKSDIWLQILADIWQKTLLVPQFLEEATSMGAAICGGVGIGAFNSFSVVSRFNPTERKITPNPANYQVYEKLFALFNQIYDALCPVYKQHSDL